MKQECIPVGCVPSADMAVGGVCPAGGVSARSGVCPGDAHLPLWTEFLTHAYESITFPQLLLRTVKRIDNCFRMKIVILS